MGAAARLVQQGETGLPPGSNAAFKAVHLGPVVPDHQLAQTEATAAHRADEQDRPVLGNGTVPLDDLPQGNQGRAD